MNITAEQWKQLWHGAADAIENSKDYLSELDRAVGDGDHGVTMSLGFQAIKDKLNELEAETDCGALSKAMGMTFLNAVGSSVGPLYATAFLRGSAVLAGKSELSDDDIAGFWSAAVNGIAERGKAKAGDKTMMDTWLPAIEALQQKREQGGDAAASLQAAAAAGKQGMEATASMESKLGRSSRLGERALGHLDPGAVSASILLTAFADQLAAYN